MGQCNPRPEGTREVTDPGIARAEEMVPPQTSHCSLTSPSIPLHDLAPSGKKKGTMVYKHLFIADISGTDTWKSCIADFTQGGLRGSRFLPLSPTSTPQIHSSQEISPMKSPEYAVLSNSTSSSPVPSVARQPVGVCGSPWLPSIVQEGRGLCRSGKAVVPSPILKPLTGHQPKSWVWF